MDQPLGSSNGRPPLPALAPMASAGPMPLIGPRKNGTTFNTSDASDTTTATTATTHHLQPELIASNYDNFTTASLSGHLSRGHNDGQQSPFVHLAAAATNASLSTEPSLEQLNQLNQQDQHHLQQSHQLLAQLISNLNLTTAINLGNDSADNLQSRLLMMDSLQISEEYELNLLKFPSRQEDLSMAIPLTVIFALLLLTGCIGNMCTAIVIARPKNKYMHTATNFYLFSLAMSDFLLLILGLPQEMYTLWQRYPYAFGESFCIIRGYLSEASTYASILTISAFTVERYVAICHPLWAHTMSQLPRAITSIVIIWLVAAVCAIFPAAELGIITQRGPITNRVLEQSAQCATKRTIYENMFVVSAIFFFIVPMIIVTVLYILIAIELRRSSKMNSKIQKQASSHLYGPPLASQSSCGAKQQQLSRLRPAGPRLHLGQQQPGAGGGGGRAQQLLQARPKSAIGTEQPGPVCCGSCSPLPPLISANQSLAGSLLQLPHYFGQAAKSLWSASSQTLAACEQRQRQTCCQAASFCAQAAKAGQQRALSRQHSPLSYHESLIQRQAPASLTNSSVSSLNCVGGADEPQTAGPKQPHQMSLARSPMGGGLCCCRCCCCRNHQHPPRLTASSQQLIHHSASQHEQQQHHHHHQHQHHNHNHQHYQHHQHQQPFIKQQMQTRRSAGASSKKSVIRMLVAVVVSFFICWVPFHSQRLLASYLAKDENQNQLLLDIYSKITYISGIMYYLSSTINPLLYQLMSAKFRRAFKETFKCSLFPLDALWCMGRKLSSATLDGDPAAGLGPGPTSNTNEPLGAAGYLAIEQAKCRAAGLAACKPNKTTGQLYSTKHYHSHHSMSPATSSTGARQHPQHPQHQQHRLLALRNLTLDSSDSAAPNARPSCYSTQPAAASNQPVANPTNERTDNAPDNGAATTGALDPVDTKPGLNGCQQQQPLPAMAHSCCAENQTANEIVYNHQPTNYHLALLHQLARRLVALPKAQMGAQTVGHQCCCCCRNCKAGPKFSSPNKADEARPSGQQRIIKKRRPIRSILKFIVHRKRCDQTNPSSEQLASGRPQLSGGATTNLMVVRPSQADSISRDEADKLLGDNCDAPAADQAVVVVVDGDRGERAPSMRHQQPADQASNMSRLIEATRDTDEDTCSNGDAILRVSMREGDSLVGGQNFTDKKGGISCDSDELNALFPLGGIELHDEGQLIESSGSRSSNLVTNLAAIANYQTTSTTSQASSLSANQSINTNGSDGRHSSSSSGCGAGDELLTHETGTTGSIVRISDGLQCINQPVVTESHGQHKLISCETSSGSSAGPSLVSDCIGRRHSSEHQMLALVDGVYNETKCGEHQQHWLMDMSSDKRAARRLSLQQKVGNQLDQFTLLMIHDKSSNAKPSMVQKDCNENKDNYNYSNVDTTDHSREISDTHSTNNSVVRNHDPKLNKQIRTHRLSSSSLSSSEQKQSDQGLSLFNTTTSQRNENDNLQLHTNSMGNLQPAKYLDPLPPQTTETIGNNCT